MNRSVLHTTFSSFLVFFFLLLFKIMYSLFTFLFNIFNFGPSKLPYGIAPEAFESN